MKKDIKKELVKRAQIIHMILDEDGITVDLMDLDIEEHTIAFSISTSRNMKEILEKLFLKWDEVNAVTVFYDDSGNKRLVIKFREY